MRLVLLPGMDGTGELFEAFTQCYRSEYTIIPLPSSGDQSYEGIADKVIGILPDQDFILLLESFSGGLAVHLLDKCSHIKAIIFVASFMSCPNALLTRIAKYLPIKTFLNLKCLNRVYKFLFFEPDTSHEVLSKFKNSVNQVSGSILLKRLSAIYSLRVPAAFCSDVPVVYIRPMRDKLVVDTKISEIKCHFNTFKVVYVDGPHFILQTKAKGLAEIIHDEVRGLG